SAGVTAVPSETRRVAWPTAPSQTHAIPDSPGSHHGWKWSLHATPSKPASSASTACRSRSSGGNCSCAAPKRNRVTSMVPQRRDELLLAHLRAALDPDLARLLQQVLFGPVLVASGLAALAAGRTAAARVRDPPRLLLALALAAERLVLLVVLDARPVVL